MMIEYERSLSSSPKCEPGPFIEIWYKEQKVVSYERVGAIRMMYSQGGIGNDVPAELNSPKC